MTHWLHEAGIGEDRAALIDANRIVAARIQRHADTWLCGSVTEAKLLARSAGGHRARALLPDGSEAVLQPVPWGASEGATIRAEIVREAMVEPGSRRIKPPRLRPAPPDTPLRSAPALFEQIGTDGTQIVHCHGIGPDRFAAAGWQEVIGEAESGQVAFVGGLLTISPTPAMTVIDVDGDIAPRQLAMAAAPALAMAIRRHGIGGGIVVDFPGLEARADRNAVAGCFDAAMDVACERTAINGFGLMQIIARRSRPSLIEMHLTDPVRWHLLGKLRSAERDRGAGPLLLDLTNAESNLLHRHPEWLDELQRRAGRPVAVNSCAD